MICSVCGKSVDVPKWHPDFASLSHRTAQGQPQYICQTCSDRIRADALRQHDPDEPGSGA
jgi:DNA-directed RNA polymerase subunit RPC12/RpoP